jgi:CubicO group peptidase (beta-lactamase class C family)
MEAQLRSEVGEGKMPGLSAAVVVDQEVLWSGGFGFANLERRIPATSDTVYRVASITKLFMATALMHLRDAGRLRLDDPLTQYVPEFRPVCPFDDCPPVTLRHLVSHTAGLPREAPLDHWLTLRSTTVEEVLESLREAELLNPPLTELHYSNLGFILLGLAMERASGRPYQQYIADEILRPLGMEQTGFDLNDTMRSALATGYLREDEEATPISAPQWELGAMRAPGGLYSSVTDLCRFLMMQFRDVPAGGRQVLAGSTLREMRLPALPQPNGAGHGVGWATGRRRDHVFVGHGGSVHGFRTATILLPGRKVGVAVFANIAPCDPDGICWRMLDVLAPVMERVPPKEAGAKTRAEPQLVPEAAAYVGRYVFLGSALQVAAHRRGLVLQSGDEGLASCPRLEPCGTDRFRVRGGGSNGELARFERDGEGHIVRLWIGAYPYERQG